MAANPEPVLYGIAERNGEARKRLLSSAGAWWCVKVGVGVYALYSFTAIGFLHEFINMGPVQQESLLYLTCLPVCPVHPSNRPTIQSSIIYQSSINHLSVNHFIYYPSLVTRSMMLFVVRLCKACNTPLLVQYWGAQYWWSKRAALRGTRVPPRPKGKKEKAYLAGFSCIDRPAALSLMLRSFVRFCGH